MKAKTIVIGGALVALALFVADPEAQLSENNPFNLLSLLPFIPERPKKAKKPSTAEKVAKGEQKKPPAKQKVPNAAEKAAKGASQAAEKTAQKTTTEVVEKAAQKATTEVAEKAAQKATSEAAEKLAQKTATEAAEKAAQKAAAETAKKAAAEAAEIAAKKAAAEAAEIAAKKAAAEASEKAAARVAQRIAARTARAAATAAKLAQLTARSASADPVAMLDMLAMGIIIALQNTIKDLDPEAYRDPRPGMISYSQLPEAVKAVFSMIPLWGTIGDFALPFFEFGAGCPEGSSQEFPGSLCLPKCRDGYRGLWGDIFCYKDYGPEWENSKEHSDWPIIPTTMKKIIRTNTGVPLSTCGPDQEKNGLLCYDKCPDGYHGVGPVCWRDVYGVGIGTPVLLEDCPAGFRTDPLTCQKDLHCTGGGCNTWWEGCCSRGLFNECYGCARTSCDPIRCDGPETKGRLDHGGNCPSDRERVEGLCYKRCPDGWQHVPGAPYDCMKSGAVLSIPRGAGSPMRCAEGQTQDSLGLCYNPAPPGFRKSTLGMVETPCPPDSDDALALCTRHSYTRPGNVAFKFGIREHKGADEEY